MISLWYVSLLTMDEWVENITLWSDSSKRKADSTLQMTVLSTILNEDAWFGWNNISSTSTFQDIGPNDV
jgi:hypothetical protein